MDKILYREVEALVEGAKANADVLALNSQAKVNSQDIEHALNAANDYSGVLHAFHESFIRGAKGLDVIAESVKEFVSRLVELNVLLMQKQDETVEFTDDAIVKQDTTRYLIDPVFNQTFSQPAHKEYLLKLQQSVNFAKSIDALVSKTDERITKAFDEFGDDKTVEAIINREFNHTLTYLQTLNQIRKVRYSDMDNLMPIISAINAVVYEAMQLCVVMNRAQRFYKSNPREQTDFKPYYIMMDGVDSKGRIGEQGKHYIDTIIKGTDMLNAALKSKKVKGIDLVCDFVTYKQDEIHGVINGDINAFIALAKEVYNGSELKLVFSQGEQDSKRFPKTKPLENIQESVKGIPFDLYGNACYICREKMSSPADQIILKKGKAYTFDNLPKQTETIFE